MFLYKPRMKKWIRGLLQHGVVWLMQWWLNICVTFQAIDRQLSEWQRCLQSCLTLLQSAVGTFNSVSSREVLDEVIGSVEGKAYLQSKTVVSLQYLGYVSSQLVLMISKIIKQKQFLCCHLMTRVENSKAIKQQTLSNCYPLHIFLNFFFLIMHASTL